ncbi:DUF2249 domain-containing protein [Halodesulfurarchaeum sp.]|uniref:DUF2249 domain-containing protein n=1 Tax=Halodesulfurarchaeum sp. TaxID=1980530 RepID=UPI001BC2EC06|nr:DUF2249 domain-containing protein [Halodesulfurarchaeum sp.]
MVEETIDLRDVPPQKRHGLVMDTFEALDSEGTLTLVNDHEPRPLFYQMQAEVDTFDAEGYSVEERGTEEFVATLPKL